MTSVSITIALFAIFAGRRALTACTFPSSKAIEGRDALWRYSALVAEMEASKRRDPRPLVANSVALN
jgi:hypothetical protein